MREIDSLEKVATLGPMYFERGQGDDHEDVNVDSFINLDDDDDIFKSDHLMDGSAVAVHATRTPRVK